MFEYGFNGLGMGVLFLSNTCRLLCVTNSAQNLQNKSGNQKKLLRFAAKNRKILRRYFRQPCNKVWVLWMGEGIHQLGGMDGLHP